MLPGLMGWPGGLPICAVVSVWPKPSRRVRPQAFCTWSMISGLSGSPAPITSRSASLLRQGARSSWISMRHTVGGAHRLVTLYFCSTPSSAAAEKRA